MSYNPESQTVTAIAHGLIEAKPELFGLASYEIATAKHKRESPDIWRGDVHTMAVESAAADFFLHWGGGWFENDTFALHGYSYDEACHCGAWGELVPGKPGKDGAWTPPTRVNLAPIPASVRDLLADRAAASPMPFHGQGTAMENQERLFRNLLCVCDEGESALLGCEAIVYPPCFVHKPSGFSLDWYKHVNRGVSPSANLDFAQRFAMQTDCINSFAHDFHFVAEVRKWPVNLRRFAMGEQHRAAVASMSREQIASALAECDEWAAYFQRSLAQIKDL